MIRESLPGARITQGPADWQIIQRRLDGRADIQLAGTCRGDQGDTVAFAVEARVVDAALNRPAGASLDWQPAQMGDLGAWRVGQRDVTAGGPYRIETRVLYANGSIGCGDRIHHLGVGDLWVIAGQSNATGCGRGPAEDGPEPGVHAFRPAEVWGWADHPLCDPTGSRHPASFDRGWNDHSPWLAFGRHLRRALNIPIGLIPAPLGGSPLSRWDPGAENPDLLGNMYDLIRAASSWRDHSRFDPADGGPVFLPRPAGPVGAVAGVVWYQGCSDTGEVEAQTYAERFTRFLNGVRSALEAPHLPFVTCQLNCVAEDANRSGAGWSLIREAQRRLAATEPGVAVVPTLGLPLSDLIHNSPAANLVIGERCARAALGMVYGQDLPWRAPDLARARFDGRDGTKLLLEIANVSGELWALHPNIEQFTVSDERGGVPVKKARLTGRREIELTLAREAGRETYLHNCGGCNPRVSIFDRENRPILAFHGVRVEG